MLIAVDIDEVLVPFFHTLTKYHQKKINRTIHLPTRYRYHYAPLFNLTEKESSDLVKEFYTTDEHASMKPLPGSKFVLEKLAGNNDIVAVTGRQRYSRRYTEQLLENLYGNCIDEIYYCDHYTENAKSKAVMCETLGAGILIDDDQKICMECLHLGIPVYNFIGNPTYPWCEESTVSVRDWEEIYNRLQ